MKKGEVINGYEILRDFTVAGGGQCKWTFASRGGAEYFIKEFLAPTYPTAGSPGSKKIKEKKRKKCEAFEKHHLKLQQIIAERCARGGNLIYTLDFFRHGTKYYKVTERVDVSSMTPQDISRLRFENRLLVMKTVAHSLRVLHQADVVHGDLKPDNILVKSVDSERYTTKLIDFDSSFFSGQPPEFPEDVVGDMVFYSPELLRYVKNDGAVEPGDLTRSSDIFALGIVYCLYLTGDYPEFDRSRFNYACEAVDAGASLSVRPAEVDGASSLLERMLAREPAARPSIGQVFTELKVISSRPAPVSEPPKPGVLKGTIFNPRPASSETPRPAGVGLRGTLIGKTR